MNDVEKGKKVRRIFRRAGLSISDNEITLSLESLTDRINIWIGTSEYYLIDTKYFTWEPYDLEIEDVGLNCLVSRKKLEKWGIDNRDRMKLAITTKKFGL